MGINSRLSFVAACSRSQLFLQIKCKRPIGTVKNIIHANIHLENKFYNFLKLFTILTDGLKIGCL